MCHFTMKMIRNVISSISININRYSFHRYFFVWSIEISRFPNIISGPTNLAKKSETVFSLKSLYKSCKARRGHKPRRVKPSYPCRFLSNQVSVIISISYFFANRVPKKPNEKLTAREAASVIKNHIALVAMRVLLIKEKSTINIAKKIFLPFVL